MNKDRYIEIEKYMKECMEDSAHDNSHIYRVLYSALEIADSEENVDYDVLIASCLLHDIGRKEQYANPSLCHAAVGAEKAYSFLIGSDFTKEYAQKVRHCIAAHRYRSGIEPQSIEAKILFDADKLDVSGAIGIARTLLYTGIVSEPLYSLKPDGTVSDGANDEKPSFFQEYKYKLEKLYSNFYTAKAAEMAKERQQAAVDYYNSILREVKISYEDGLKRLDRVVK